MFPKTKIVECVLCGEELKRSTHFKLATCFECKRKRYNQRAKEFRNKRVL